MSIPSLFAAPEGFSLIVAQPLCFTARCDVLIANDRAGLTNASSQAHVAAMRECQRTDLSANCVAHKCKFHLTRTYVWASHHR